MSDRVLRWVKPALALAAAAAAVIMLLLSTQFQTKGEAAASVEAIKGYVVDKLTAAEALNAERQVTMNRRLDEQSETLRDIHRLLLREARRRNDR